MNRGWQKERARSHKKWQDSAGRIGKDFAAWRQLHTILVLPDASQSKNFSGLPGGPKGI